MNKTEIKILENLIGSLALKRHTFHYPSKAEVKAVYNMRKADLVRIVRKQNVQTVVTDYVIAANQSRDFLDNGFVLLDIDKDGNLTEH